MLHHATPKAPSVTCIAALLALLSACSSSDAVPMQEVKITSLPPGATCLVEQGNKPTWRHAMVTGRETLHYQTVGNITTPATITVPNSDSDLHITCNLQGYKETSVTDESAPSTWSIPGAKTGWQYTSPMNVMMEKP